MSRISRTPLDDPTLSHRLQWHASQSLRRGIRCSVIVLQPLTIEQHGGSDACDESGEGPLDEIARRLRGVLRRTDVVEVDPTVGIGVLLSEADAFGTSAVQARIMRELGQRPSGRGRQGSVEDMRFAIGRASAEVTDPAQLPAVVRDLVCVASSPDVWMCVSVVRPARRTAARRGRHAACDLPRAVRPIQPRCNDLRIVSPELGVASTSAEGEALRRMADEQGVPFVRIPSDLPASLRRILSPELARELGAVPIGRTRGVLTVAMRDSSDLSAMQRLATATGLTIFPVLAAPDDLARGLAALDPAGARRHVPAPTV
jgi:MshEN domain